MLCTCITEFTVELINHTFLLQVFLSKQLNAAVIALTIIGFITLHALEQQGPSVYSILLSYNYTHGSIIGALCISKGMMTS